jgi:protein-disulfide isomerase
MTREWKMALLAGLGGAALSLVIVLGLAYAGLLPERNRDAQFHDYLMSHASILADMSVKMQADQQAADDATRQAAVNKLGMKAFFDPHVAFITGPADAKTTMVEFFDYNCPYCRASLPAVKKFYAANKGSARLAFIDFPIKGPNSVIAARAAVAARKQPAKYVLFHFLLMEEEELVTADTVFQDARKAGLNVDKLKADMMDKSVDVDIAAAKRLADAAKVDGTPAFIINGTMREGALTDDVLTSLTKKS